jgi:hypothetical protein
MISKQAKQLEKEIKDIEDEIESIKKFKSVQQGVEKNTLLNELKSKSNKLTQRQDKYENDYKKKIDEFKQIKNNIYNLFIVLECNSDVSQNNLLLMENGITESNVKLYLSEIENKLKVILRFFEMERMNMEDVDIKKIDSNKEKIHPKQVSDNMKMAFAAMGKFFLILFINIQ